MKQRKIVHITHVTLCTQNLFAEMIQPVKIDIGEKLTGQIANWKPSASFMRREQIVPRKILYNRLLRIGCIDNPVCQFQPMLRVRLWPCPVRIKLRATTRGLRPLVPRSKEVKIYGVSVRATRNPSL